MKEVLMSFNPKWVEKICNEVGEERGKPIYEKTIEVRKTKPDLATPFKVLIYVTRPKKWFRFSSFGYASDESLWLSCGTVKMHDGFSLWGVDDEYYNLNGKVIGEFICDRIDRVSQCNSGWVKEHGCISRKEFFDYLGLPYNSHLDDKGAFAWHISNLKIYDKPKKLSEFKRFCEGGKKGCSDCEYYYLENNESGRYEECCCDNLRPLKRPPQSWCYIEVEE